jgi:hypothetical protein
MANTIKAAAPLNAARFPTQSVAANNNDDPAAILSSMSAEQRVALMAQLRLAQQSDVAPLVEMKKKLEAELAEINDQIRAIKPVSDSLAVFRAVRKSVKAGNSTLGEIAAATGYDEPTVEAMLNKHVAGNETGASLFTFENNKYRLASKTKKS